MIKYIRTIIITICNSITIIIYIKTTTSIIIINCRENTNSFISFHIRKWCNFLSILNWNNSLFIQNIQLTYWPISRTYHTKRLKVTCRQIIHTIFQPSLEFIIRLSISSFSFSFIYCWYISLIQNFHLNTIFL